MVNLFAFASNDQAIQYLAQIFGPMNGILALPGQGGGSSSITLLGSMFQTFNSIVLAVGALILVYTTALGVMLTAHEGEFMGKKWNNPWIPIRMVLGIAALVPSGSGYSALQMIMMWVIVQGIGAADTLWGTVLSYVNSVGSPYAQVTIPTLQSQNAIQTLFQDMVCDATARLTYPNPNITLPKSQSHGGYYCYNNPSAKSFCDSQPSQPINGSLLLGPPSDSCGQMNYGNGDATGSSCANPANPSAGLKCAANQAQQTAMASIVPLLREIASNVANVDYQYQKFYYASKQASANHQTQPDVPEFVQKYCDATKTSPCTGDSLPSPGLGASSPPDSLVQNLYWPYAILPTLPAGQANFIETTTAYYTNAITTQVNAYLQQAVQNNNNNGTLNNNALNQLGNGGASLQYALNTGWVFAGAYYFNLAQFSSNNLTNAIPTFNVQSANITSDSNPISAYRNNYTAAGTIVSMVSQNSNSSSNSNNNSSSANHFNANSGGLASTGNPALTQIGGVFTSLFSNVQQEFMQQTGGNSASGGSSTSNGNANGGAALVGLFAFGQTLLAIVPLFFIDLVGINFTYLTMGFFSVEAAGFGFANPIGSMISVIEILLLPAMMAALATLFAIGATLGIYLPFAPYMLFTFGVIAWMVSTIEAMVAGPLVALGILSPSGQHELLGKAEPALLLIFYAFLRPSLMIFGMIASMLLSPVAVELINASFWQIMVASMWEAMLNPVELILVLVLYVFLIVTALNKCFALIYLIPRQVMDWIGGHHVVRDGGEAEGAGEAKAGLRSGTAALAGAHTQGAGMAKQAGSALGKEKASKKAQSTTLGSGGSGSGGKPPATT